jgi:hypothetical protein
VAGSAASRPPTAEATEGRALAARILSLPRESGSPGLDQARALVADRLRELGFSVELQPFRCTAAALVPLPLIGAGLGWLALLVAPLLVLPTPPRWLALAVWAAGALSLGLFAAGAAAGHAPAGWIGPTRDDANLIATRSPAVRRWIVAHLDTKAQGHSMAGRLVAVWLMLLAAVCLSGLGVARLGGPVPAALAASAAGVAVLAGALATRGRLQGVTQGARDNGSGVIAALAAAEATRDPGIGILISGGEELGLIGARLFARDRAAMLAGAEAVNLDTIDGRGPLWVVSHDARGDALADRAVARLAGLGLEVRRRRLPFGILTDSLALARIGTPAITIARLDWSTLGRIHTPRDTAADLSLEAAERVGCAVARSI